MARRNQFTVDAESVQGIEGAEITFRRLTVGVWQQYFDDSEYNNPEIVRDHVVDWKGIVDDDGNEIPSPKDEPGVIAVLYLDEVNAMSRLLFQGVDGAAAKN